MVVVLVVVVALSRLKQEVSSYHFENRASETPHISRGVVVSADYDLWGPVLPGLDLWGEMMVGPAAIAHIADLYLHVFVDLRSTSLFGLAVLLLQLIFVVQKQPTNLVAAEVHASLLDVLLLSDLGLILLIQDLVADLAHNISVFLLLLSGLGNIVSFALFLSVFQLVLLLLLLELLLQILSLLGSQSF